MKQSELFLKFAKCIKMIEDSNNQISASKMVKIDGHEVNYIPAFDSDDTIDYTFAIGIINATPIFVGDTVYHNRNGKCVITKVDGIYVYYTTLTGTDKGIDRGWNGYFSEFSLVDSNVIKLEDVKAFEIFRYNKEEVMIVPSNYDVNCQKYHLSGIMGDFGASFYVVPRTQQEMYEYLKDGYVKTGKRFGLIEK